MFPIDYRLYTPPALFFTPFFYFLPFSCRFFENERFFTVYPLRVHAFFVEILKMNGKKKAGGCIYIFKDKLTNSHRFTGECGSSVAFSRRAWRGVEIIHLEHFAGDNARFL